MSFVARTRLGGLLIGAGALGLLVSLSLTWSSTGFNSKNVLVAFGAIHRLQDEFNGRSGWQTYPVGAGLLAALAVLLGSIVVVRDTRARVIVALLALGALAIAIAALANPPQLIQQGQASGEFVLAFGSSAGAGEIIAVASLATALAGMILMSLRPGSQPTRRSGSLPPWAKRGAGATG